MKVGDLVKETSFDYQICLVVEKHTDCLFKVVNFSGKVEAVHKDYLEVINESR